MINFIKGLFNSSENDNLAEAMAAGATLVDVRSPQEFASGSVKGAVNIPLDKLSQNLNRLSKKNTIITFCRSGMRSMQAKSILNQNGFENVINGKTWQNVNSKLKN